MRFFAFSIPASPNSVARKKRKAAFPAAPSSVVAVYCFAVSSPAGFFTTGTEKLARRGNALCCLSILICSKLETFIIRLSESNCGAVICDRVA